MNIILVGPPGAGKGTVSDAIKNEFRLPYFSTGMILRNEAKKGTKLGLEADELISNGQFVPDDMIVGVVKEALAETVKGYILDGFPRNLAQAVIFEKMLAESGDKLDAVIHLTASDEEIKDRLTNRLICPKCESTYHKLTKKPQRQWLCDHCSVELTQRDDDKPELVQKRLGIYHETTEPIVAFYKEKGMVVSIDAQCAIEEMIQRVIEALKSQTRQKT